VVTLASALERVRGLGRQGLEEIEEPKAIPWRKLSLEQKYVCLGARLNESLENTWLKRAENYPWRRLCNKMGIFPIDYKRTMGKIIVIPWQSRK
jgi:hypothetical protein